MKKRSAEIPEELLGYAPLVKLVWVWLAPLGWVEFTQRDISEKLGIALNGVVRAFTAFKEVGLIEYESPPQERRNSRYRIKPRR